MTELEDIEKSLNEQMTQLDQLLRGHEVFSKIIEHAQEFMRNMEEIGEAIDSPPATNKQNYFYWGTLLGGVISAYKNLARQIILSLVNCDDLYAHAEKQFNKLSEALLKRLGKKCTTNRKFFIAAVERATINNPSTTAEIIRTLFGIPMPGIEGFAPEFGKLIEIINSFSHNGGKNAAGKIEITCAITTKVHSLVDQVVAEFLATIQKHSSI